MYLGSICDQRLLNKIHTYQIDTVYHAAAYKHVPIVRIMRVAVENNIVGTYLLANTSTFNVSNFVFISSTKL